jgi:hypothetical protein
MMFPLRRYLTVANLKGAPPRIEQIPPGVSWSVNGKHGAPVESSERRLFCADESAWEELQQLLSRPPALPPPMSELLSKPSILDRPA